MGTPWEDAAYQRKLAQYRVWCEETGQMPDPAFIEELARHYNQGLHAEGMGPGTPQPTAPAVPGGGAPTVPGGAALQPTGQAPSTLDEMRGLFPWVSDEEWGMVATAYESLDLNYMPGFEWFKMWVETGAYVYVNELAHAQDEANAESARITADAAAQNAETNRLYSLGMLEEAKLSREQELLMSRELNALNQYIAEMQNQVSTLGLQIQERAYGAQLGAHPVNTVEFELWKRAGGSLEPVDIPEAPVPQEPVVPGAIPTEGVPTAPTVPGAQKGLSIYSPKGNVPVNTAQSGKLHTTGEEGWEYMRPGPGTVVAPRAQGETRPTQEGGFRAINRQLEGTQAGTTAVPERRRAVEYLQWKEEFNRTHGRYPTAVESARWFRFIEPIAEPAPVGAAPPPEAGPVPPVKPTQPGEAPRRVGPVLDIYVPGHTARSTWGPTAGGTQGGKRVPYAWMKRRQALGFQGEPVPGAQGGYVDPGTHTDEEMAAAFASAMEGWPALYNPGLTGIGQFGERIPGPGQVSRRQYYSMDPSGHEMLKSHLASGFKTPEYGQIGGESLVMDWLRQMQRSWIPGLEGAKRSVSYAY